MLQLSISLGIIGICTGVVPILTDFWLLVVIVTLGGVIVGFNDALIQEYFMKPKIVQKQAQSLKRFHWIFVSFCTPNNTL